MIRTWQSPRWEAQLCVGDSEYVTADDLDVRVARRANRPGVLLSRVYFALILQCNQPYIVDHNTQLIGRDLSESLGAAMHGKKMLESELLKSEFLGVENVVSEIDLPPQVAGDRPVSYRFRQWVVAWRANLEINSDYDLPDHPAHSTPHLAPEVDGPPIPKIPDTLEFRYITNGETETVTYTRDG